MKQNFFEVLGIANIERIHSQMWLYFFNNDFLSNEQKTYILNNFFGAKGKYQNFKCYTEYKNIDVLIIADNKVFAIENKIKIGQHDNQLEKYYKILKDDYKIEPFCVYLSLIGENSYRQNWRPRSYKDLLNILQKIYFEEPKEFKKLIFNEYVDSLKRLTKVFDKFSSYHEEFYQVFWDGSKTKDKKRELMDGDYYKTEDQKYIALNQLETIFQKHFLLRVAKELNIDFYSKELPKAHIDEARGNALLHIDIRNGCNKNFVFGIQFQSETVKITYSKKDYINSFKTELGEKIEVFKKIGLKNGLRFNPPKTKAYMSISKKMGKKSIWKKDFNIVINIYKDVYKECRNLIQEIEF